MFFSKIFKSDKPEEPPPTRRKSSEQKQKKTERTRRHRQRCSVEDLRVGMYVVELDIPWEESTFMFQGLEIKSANDIIELQKQCKYVYVDFDEYRLRQERDSNGLPAARNPAESLVSVQEEFETAKSVHSLAGETVKNLFKDIRLGAQIDGGKIKQAVNGCVTSILRNPDASVWLTRIQSKDEGTAQHSLNVAALSVVLAKSLNLQPRELEDVGVCAMLHDVGKTSIPTELLRKPGKLTADEMQEMRKHTRYGRDILLSTTSVMSGAADVAHAHHERPDGKGYPRGLTAEKIPVYAKIVAIAEAYDVMTTRQPYREALSPSEALQELYSKRGTQFDDELVLKFIDSIGVFPPGSIVELVTGQIGIVLSTTADKLRPRVILILDSDKEPTQQSVIDLSQNTMNHQGEVYQIKTTLSDGSYGINVEDFQRAGLRVG